MFILKESFTSCNRFIADDKILLLHCNGNLSINGFDYNFIEKKFLGDFFVHNEDTIIAQSYNGYFYVISLQSKSISKNIGYYNYFIKGEIGIFFFDVLSDTLKKIFNDKIISLGFKHNGYLIEQNYIEIVDLQKLIKVSDFITQNLVWQFSFSSLGTYMDGALEREYKLQKFCGNYCNKLILVLENSDVLLLDANTGKLLQHFKDVYFNYYSTPKAEGSNLYWSLVGKHFTEIDVENQVVTRQLNLEAELLRHNAQDPKNTFYVFIKRIVVYKELIYFYTSDNQLGIFSPQEEKIIWFLKMDIGQPSGNFFTDIQVNDTNIYVLDYEGMLHIFEKEK